MSSHSSDLELPEDRIRVTKRETVKTADGYRSCEISIERSRPSGVTIADAIVDQETEVDSALDRFRKETARSTTTASTAPPATTASAPVSSPATSPRIPETGWTSFKSGKGSWIRTEEAAELAALLSKCDKKSAVISGYLYKLSGDSDQFVNRFAHNGGSSK